MKLAALLAGGAAASLISLSAALAQGDAPDPAAAAKAALAAAKDAPAFEAYKPGDVRVYLSPALRGAFDKVKPQAEAALGHKLVVEVKQARLLQVGIESGQPFEVAVLTEAAMDAVAAKNHVKDTTKLAGIALGVAARGDIGKVDASTPEALKKTIAGAKTVRRNYGVGASVPLVDHMVKTLDVGPVVEPKVIAMVGAVGPPVPLQTLAPGEYELMFNMVSELQARPGWTFVSAIPEELRLPTEFFAGVGPQGDQASAEALMTFLKGPVFTQALRDMGIEPMSDKGPGAKRVVASSAR